MGAAVIRAFLPSLPIIIENPQANYENCQLQPLQAKIIRHFAREEDSVEMLSKYPIFPSCCLRPLKYLSEGIFHRVYLAEYRPPSLADDGDEDVVTKVTVKYIYTMYSIIFTKDFNYSLQNRSKS